MNLILGDCLEKLKELPDNSVDSVVTDPPYGISFMAKKWDYDVPKVEVWQEVLRVLKPGGHALVACGTRTQHRMAVNLEDAGFEIRDIVAWVYGSGFPKSLNIGKVLSQGFSQFEGWGTALKPAMELFTLCRKPLSEKNIAENCLKWGTGGINIDGCRINEGKQPGFRKSGGFNSGGNSNVYGDSNGVANREYLDGRFPANLIHDGSDEVLSLFPNDAARFFYCPKAGRKERNDGLDKFEDVRSPGYYGGKGSICEYRQTMKKNFHPTVKPIALMSYLCRLITPPNGTILDPFMGSGSTGCGAAKEGFNFTGIEIDPEYFKIAEARILYHSGTLFNPNSDKKE